MVVVFFLARKVEKVIQYNGKGTRFSACCGGNYVVITILITYGINPNATSHSKHPSQRIQNYTLNPHEISS